MRSRSCAMKSRLVANGAIAGSRRHQPQQLVEDRAIVLVYLVVFHADLAGLLHVDIHERLDAGAHLFADELRQFAQFIGDGQISR